MLQTIVYVAGLIIIYIGSAVVEKKWPGTLRAPDGYGIFVMLTLIWPITLSFFVFAAIGLPAFWLVSWPWRKFVMNDGSFFPGTKKGNEEP